MGESSRSLVFIVMMISRFPKMIMAYKTRNNKKHAFAIVLSCVSPRRMNSVTLFLLSIDTK